MTRKYFLSALNICLMVFLSIILVVGLLQIEIFSKKTTYLIIASLFIVIFILTRLYLSKNVHKYNVGAFVALIINIILVFEIVNINNKYSYLENLVSNNYKYNTYELYVKKSNTKYSKIEKLDGKTIGILRRNSDNVEAYISTLVNVKYKKYSNVDELYIAIANGEIQAFIVPDQVKDKVNENESKNKVRIIYKNRIKESI